MVVAILLAVVATLIVLYWVFDLRRYRGKRGQERSRPTGEVFRDPGSGRVMRVYEDPETGKREYRPEG